MVAAPAVLTTDRSASVLIVVVAVELLLNGLESVEVGGEVGAVIVAVFETELPFAAVETTLATRVKVAEAPDTKLERLQKMGPLEPTDGVKQTNIGPVDCVKDWNVSVAGRASLRETFTASEGPLFAAVIV